MRSLWFGRAFIGLIDVVVLRCTVGPKASFAPRRRGHSFAVSAAMPIFSMALQIFVLPPAKRQALANLAVRAGLLHVPVALSQVRSLARRTPRLWSDPRDVWNVVTKMLSPTPSLKDSGDANNQAFTESSSPPIRMAQSRGSTYTAKVGGSRFAADEVLFEEAGSKMVHPGERDRSDQRLSDQALVQELVARAIAHAIEDAIEDATAKVPSSSSPLRATPLRQTPFQRTRPDASFVADRPQQHRFPDDRDSSNYQTHSHLSGFSGVVGSSGSSVGFKLSSEWDDNDSQIEGE